MVELKRTLGYPAIIALSLTAMMGTGMFFGTTIAANTGNLGNASLLAWIGLAIIAYYVSLCFAELSSMYPNAGGVYEFAKQAYGRFPSFMIGWTTWLVGNITATVMIVAGMSYVFPAAEHHIIKIALSLLLILVLNVIAYRGIEVSTKILMVLATITIISFLAILIPGTFHINPQNYTPFLTVPAYIIFVALFFIMESLFGWESATFLSEETKNPEKVIPKSLIISTILAGLFAFAIPFVTLGAIPWQMLTDAPFLQIGQLIYGMNSSPVFIGVMALTMVAASAGIFVSNPRLLLALARDKLFIEQLSDIHQKYNTPYKAIFFQMIVSIIILFIGFGAYQTLLSLLVPLALLMYVSVLLAVVILRIKDPYRVRVYKAPMGKIGPIIVSLIYLAIVGFWVYLDPSGWQLFRIALSFILFGVPIFLLLLFYYNPSAAIGFNNRFAGISMYLENFFLPRKIRKTILEIFKDIQGKTILEYGAGVGTLTMHLMEGIGPTGRILATDASYKNLSLLEKRLRKKRITNFHLIHDEHQFNRIHPSIKSVDMVFSVGMMSYMQEVVKVLKALNEILPEHGKICMIDYVDFFKIIPDPKWMENNDKVKEHFKKAGFSVEVKRIKGVLWNYLLVYGIKTRHDVPFI